MSKLYVMVVLFLGCTTLSAQTDSFVAIDAPSQNFVKFNRFLVNPTFSLVGETTSKISLYNRRQWIDFDNSPEVYMLNYSGLISDKVAVGLNLYQQNSGILKNFGVMANYAYRLDLNEKIGITFGFNAAYVISGLNKSKVSGDPDPALETMVDNSMFLFMPGANLRIGRFDIGLYAEDLIDYNLKTSESLTEFKDKTFSGHIMYTQPFSIGSGLFKDASMQITARNRRTTEYGSVLAGNLLFDIPKIGWIQGGYNDYYGYSAGIGINVSKHISFGYLLEKGINQDIKNFGNTHEITIGYSFAPLKAKKKKQEKELLRVDASLVKDVDQLKKDVKVLKENQAASNIERLEEIKKSQPNNGVKVVSNKGKQTENKEGAINPNTHDANGVQYQYLGKVPGVKSGYYLVSNVLKNKELSIKTVASLNKQGFMSDYFENSNNGYYYVYLDKYISWNKVKEAAKSKYNGTYSNSLFVMDVAGKEKIDVSAYTNTTKKNVTKSISDHSDDVDEVSEDEIKLKYSSKDRKSRETAHRVAMNINNVQNGYYLVASVFSKKSNADRFIKKLKAKGIEGRYFINPKNNYHYVYLEYSKQKATSLKGYYSNLNNSYFDDMWLMHVKSNKKEIKQPVELAISGVSSGYYIVVGVFTNYSNSKKIVEKLKQKGIDVRYFTNPKNNFQYVYIYHSKDKSSASKAFYSNINNTYFGEKWIMTVKNK